MTTDLPTTSTLAFTIDDIQISLHVMSTQARATRQRTRHSSSSVEPVDPSSRLSSLVYWSLLLPIAVWLFVPSNGNGDSSSTSATASGTVTASPPPALADPAITTPLAAAILPSQQQAAAAPLAPALEEILRSLDEQAYQATLVGRDDDDDGIDDDDDDDTADARDVERPLLRRSRAARAKERINKQRRVIIQKLAGLRRAEKEINPTGGPLLPALRAIYGFLSPVVLATLYYLLLPVTLPLSLLWLPFRLAYSMLALLAPLAVLLLGFALVGGAWGLAGAGVLRLWRAATQDVEQDDAADDQQRRASNDKGRAIDGRSSTMFARAAPGDGRWSTPSAKDRSRRKAA